MTHLLLPGRVRSTLLAVFAGLWLFVAVARAAAPPEPGWTHASWSLRDGLPVLSFSGMAQDRDGYLWISTFDGLVRFDGARFTVMDPTTHPELTSSRFSLVLADPGGGVWVGSEVDGLLHVGPDGARVVRQDGRPLSALNLSSIATRPGELIESAGEQLVRVRGDRVTPLADLKGLGIARRPRREPNGDVWWIGNAEAVRLRGDRVTRVPLPADLRLRGGDGDYWWTREGSETWYQRGDRFLKITPDGVVRAAGPPADARRYRRTRTDAIADPQLRAPDGALWEGREGHLFRDGVAVAEVGGEVSLLLAARDGTIWAAASDGLHRIARATVSVVGARHDGRPVILSALHESHDGAIWMVGIEGVVGRWSAGGLKMTKVGRVLTAIAEPKPGEILLGTFGGLARLGSGPGTVLQPLMSGPMMETSLLAMDRDSMLWCGARDSLHVGQLGAWFVVAPTSDVPGVSVRSLLHRRDGSHWFGTAGRGILVLSDGKAEFLDAKQGLPSARVRGLYEDERGIVWAATEGAGLARIELATGAPVSRAKVTAIRRRDGLLDDTMHAILEDDRHRLWVSTNRGIFCVSRERLDAFARGDRTAITIRAFGEAQGMVSRECNGTSQPAALRASDGTLWFVTQAGAVAIDPRRVPDESPTRALSVDDVVSRNERVAVRDGAVRLSPRQREFAVSYSSAEFLAPQQLRFRYRLREHGGEWIEAGERRTAYFSEVAPGRHTFEVQVSSGGPWSASATLRLDVVPRWYETTVFEVIALAALVAMLWAAYRRRLSALVERERELQAQVATRTADLVREQQATEAARAAAESARADAESARDLAQRSLETIEKQAEELRALDEAKSRFFANVSHEFRTPLTLTIGPLEDLLGGLYGPPSVDAREPLELALRNANRALAQVNRILDLARLEAGGMTLHAREGDLARELREVAALFVPLAVRRGVALDVDVKDGSPAWFDRALLEQAVANLLSNALKFTPLGGHVRLTGGVERDGDAARWTFAVRDDGPGIAPDEQSRLFERFYQASGARDVARPGTGIGLSLTRDIVELHGGTITLVSAPGEGSTFTVRLPLGRARHSEGAASGAPERDAPRTSATWLLADAPGTSEAASAPPEPAEAATDAPTVLVVEDDADVRAYLRRHLAPHYRVVEAGDGAAALASARALPPDLVISDVMMPVMDGFAFCEAMQAEPDLAGTPVILLTARASHDDKLAGLSLGAVDYLAKPFHAPELLLRVRNLIAAQHRLRERLRPRELHAAAVEVTSEDDRFLARVRDAIERTMGDEDFELDKIAQEAGLGRSQFFRRVKDLLGETPEQLVRRLRLERAAQLLEQRAGSVGEIAYATGFKSVAHFCRVFREHHGATPGSWAERSSAT